jgi:hypothetical protein
MNPVTQHEPASIPNAEWHGGVAEHALETQGVSKGIKNDSFSYTRWATNSTACSVLAWLVLWALLLLPVAQGFVPTADDLGAYHLPLRAFYQSSLQAGENWTWCPWIFGGYHLHGEGQIGGDHPLHQLLYRVLPLHWAFGLECWWAYPATFFGMWWWLRQMRFSTGASQVAAIAFSLCGFMTLRIVHTNAVQVIAHLPWLLACLTWLDHRARRSTSLRSLLLPIACSALLTGSQLLLGYPQYVVFSLIAETLWAGALFLRLQQREKAKDTAWIFASGWITAKVLGLLLGAAQVLPTLEYLSLSERVNWTSEQMFEGSWPLLNLTQLVAPYLFTNRVVGQNTHELTIFMGIVPVSLAVLGLVNRPRRSQRAVKGFAIALCAVGLLLALGDMSPLAKVMPYIPVWNRFRFPCRATLLLCLGISLLAALGCQRIIQFAKTSRPRLENANLTIQFSATERRWMHGLLCLSILVPIYGSIAWREHVAGWEYALFGPVSIVLAWVVFYFASKATANRRLLLLAVAGELLLYAGTYDSWQSLTNLAWNIEFNEHHASRSSQPEHISRSIASANATRGNQNIAPHLLRQDGKFGERLNPFATIDGYVGVQPRRQLIYDLEHPGALRAAGVTHSHCLNNRSQIETTSLKQSPALARGTLITQTQPAIQPSRRIEQIDMQQVALVADFLGLVPATAEDRLQLEVTTDRPGDIAFDLDSNRDSLLVTTESFHPGWHARVDDSEAPVLRVNGDFLGVRIPASARRIECYFSDNWHTVGRWISLGSLGLLVLVMCWSRLRQSALGFAL